MSRPPPPSRGYHPPGPRGYAPPPHAYGPPGGYMPGPGYADPNYYPPGPPGPGGYGGPPPRYGGPGPPKEGRFYDTVYSSDEMSSGPGSRPPRGNQRMGYGQGSNIPDSSRRHTGSGSGFDSGSNSDAAMRSVGGDDGRRPPYANDCEIIVMQKAQQQYAEMVEKQMRDVGLNVDIMFPKGDVKMTEFLKPIAKLGTIFAILIEGENERNKTIHFYQFRGVPKPTLCKNVRLNMGIEMILKKYDELKQKEIGVVPEHVKHLLQRLLEEQPLKDIDYIELVRFLQERRNRQNSFLNRTSNEVSEPKSDAASLMETPEGKDIQKRIVEILNEYNDSENATKP